MASLAHSEFEGLKALPHFQAATRLLPKDQIAWIGLADACRQVGNAKNATDGVGLGVVTLGAFALTCRTLVDGASLKLETDSAGLREKNWRGSLTASVLEGIGWPGSLIFSSRNIESPDGAERGFV